MAKWPGLPERLRLAFERAGYWKNGRPDVLGFSLGHRFLAGYTYKWIGGTAVPDRENLLRLADALKVSPAWLLFGDEKPKTKRRAVHPVAGGSGDLNHDPEGDSGNGLPLIRHWLHCWLGLAPTSRRWALA